MQIRRDFLRSLEAIIVGIFLVQTVRYLYAALYADVSSADLVQRVPDRTTIENVLGYVDPATVRTDRPRMEGERDASINATSTNASAASRVCRSVQRRSRA